MLRRSSGTEWSSLDRERVSMVTGFEMQKGGNRKEGGSLHFNPVGSEGSHCRVEVVPQPHVHITHVHIGYLLLTPFRKRL